MFLCFSLSVNHDKNEIQNLSTSNLVESVRYRNLPLRSKMGHKSSKSTSDLLSSLQSDQPPIKKTHSSTSGSSTTSSSSKSKSNHDSHISNDSGCYSADRYSTPSSSSVLCLFDSNLDTIRSKQNHLSKTLTRHNSIETKSTKLTRRTNKHGKFKPDFLANRNSVCDSIILSCSSSNSSINTDESNKKAQLLCDQLNQILNISTNILGQQAQAVKASQEPVGTNLKYKTRTILINKMTNRDKDKRNKSLNLKSNTFEFDEEKCSKNVLKNFLEPIKNFENLNQQKNKNSKKKFQILC